MEEKELRGLLRERLHMELQLFKDSLLRKEKEDIFRDSYKIEIYVNLYEIFAAHTDSLKADMIRRLLHLNVGILETVYQEWLDREDSFFEELRICVCGELERIAEMGSNGQGKDDEDGKGLNKAA